MTDIRSKKYRIVVVEPSAIVAQGVKSLLASHAEFDVTACLTDLSHVTERAGTLRPDILLVNPAIFDMQKRLSVRNLFASCEQATLVAMVYHCFDPETLRQYDGEISIYDDQPRMVRKLKQALDNRRGNEETSEGYELTDRENEILVSVVKGLTNKEIASVHNISIHTVISHRKNISRKTGIKSVSGLTVYALLNNLVDQSEIE